MLLKRLHSFQILLAATTLIIIATCIFIFFYMTSRIGGIDFFYYINIGRDLVREPGSLVAQHGFYFPGILFFWKWVITAFDDRLLAVQIAYGICLFLNAALIVLVLKRFTSSSLTLLALPSYIFLLFYLDGFEGCAEPIAMAILLSTFYLSTFFKNSLRGVFILSLGLALTIYMKQPGILLLPAFFLYLLLQYRWRGVVTGGVAFLVALIGLFYLGGGGLETLRRGLFSIPKYGTQGTFVSNFFFVHSRFPLTFILFAISSLIYTWDACFAPKGHSASSSRLTQDEKATFFFFLCTVLGSFVQYRMRGFYHYELYALPGILICLGLSFKNLWLRYSRSLSLRTVSAIFAACFVLGAISTYLSRDVLLLSFDDHWRYSKVAEDRYKSLCPYLEKDELLLVPPRENAIHFICKTWTAAPQDAYSWQEEKASAFAEIIIMKRPQQVFVFNETFGGYEHTVLGDGKALVVEQALSANKYRPVFEAEYGKLYRKE